MEGIQLEYNKQMPVLEPVVKHGSLLVDDVLRQNQGLILSP